MINCWVSLEDDYVFGEWICKPTFESSESLHEFVINVFTLGLKNNLFSLRHKEIKDLNDCYSHYIHCLKELELREGKSLMFNVVDLNFFMEEFFYIDYHINAYDKQGIVQQFTTDNIGSILREVNPKETVNIGYAEDSLAFELNSYPRKIGTNYSTTIYIKLRTNIFFPEIPSVLEAPKEYFPGLKYIDNEELARINGGIFNNWFKDFKNELKKLDFEIKLSTPYSFMKDYKAYLSDDGIELD